MHQHFRDSASLLEQAKDLLGTDDDRLAFDYVIWFHREGARKMYKMAGEMGSISKEHFQAASEIVRGEWLRKALARKK